MPKDNEVDEKVIWTTDKPTTEGAYYIRGFNVCRPADEQFEALVQVRMHKPNFFASEESATLFCNLHESTSEEDMDNWIPVDELEDDFEWSGPLVSAATVAELRAEVERRKDALAAMSQFAKVAEDRADAAERRVGELEEFIREWRDDSLLRSAESRASFRLEARALTGAYPT